MFPYCETCISTDQESYFEESRGGWGEFDGQMEMKAFEQLEGSLKASGQPERQDEEVGIDEQEGAQMAESNVSNCNNEGSRTIVVLVFLVSSQIRTDGLANWIFQSEGLQIPNHDKKVIVSKADEVSNMHNKKQAVVASTGCVVFEKAAKCAGLNKEERLEAISIMTSMLRDLNMN